MLPRGHFHLHPPPHDASRVRFGGKYPLLGVFQNLIEHGATLVVIEHDLDVIRNADYHIDIEPGGGKAGGQIVAAGGRRKPGQRHRAVFEMPIMGSFKRDSRTHRCRMMAFRFSGRASARLLAAVKKDGFSCMYFAPSF